MPVNSRSAYRPNKRLPESPDISMLSPVLRQQWHVEGNMHLGPIKVKPHSNIKAVWYCIKCPAGQPHMWTARVQDRTLGTECPYCSNRMVCLHNSLATVASDVAKYWNKSKNEMMPGQVVAGSRSKAEWKCPDCGWEWRADISRAPKNRLVVPSAVMRGPADTHSPPLLKLSLPSWLSGTTSRGNLQLISLLAAVRWCTGSAQAVQEGSHTAGEQPQITAQERAVGVQSVLAGKLVFATL